MITSRQNQRLKDIRRLRRSKGDHAFLEGPHLVAAALDAGISLDEVLVSDRYTSSHEWRLLSERLDVGFTVVAANLLAELTDSDSPQGILAVARCPIAATEDVPILSVGTYVFAEGLQDPGNVGALARVAEAVGVSALCLSPGSASPNHSRALRASAGSLLRIRTSAETSLSALCARLEPVSPVVVALAPRDGLDLYGAAELTPGFASRALVLCLGSEGAGLSDASLQRADVLWTIPMIEPVESLNVTVAAALALFELRRRREGDG